MVHKNRGVKFSNWSVSLQPLPPPPHVDADETEENVMMFWTGSVALLENGGTSCEVNGGTSCEYDESIKKWIQLRIPDSTGSFSKLVVNICGDYKGLRPCPSREKVVSWCLVTKPHNQASRRRLPNLNIPKLKSSRRKHSRLKKRHGLRIEEGYSKELELRMTAGTYVGILSTTVKTTATIFHYKNFREIHQAIVEMACQEMD